MSTFLLIIFCGCIIIEDHIEICFLMHQTGSLQNYMSVIQFLLIVITILFAVGVITCVLSHYKMGARSWSDQKNKQLQTTKLFQQPCLQQQYSISFKPTNISAMYSPTVVHERQKLDAGAHQDHLVRLHSIQTDLALNLPHSISLPDGEEGPHCDSKLLKLRCPDQHAEITRSFIRPPPNRTVIDSNTIPPFRSNSVGQKPSLNMADCVFVARSQSVSSSDFHSVKSAYSPLPVSNPNVTSPTWLPSASSVSGASGISNRTYQNITGSEYDDNDPPPPYSDVINQWDVNRQHFTGI